MDMQKTIVKEVSLSGIGLHTANKANLVFKPAPVDSGINFIRVDLPARPVIKVAPENILPQSRTPRRSSVGKGDIEVQTVEHLMAALAGLEVDNLNIEIDNNEIPGLDGSALKFQELLTQAGIIQQEEERRYFSVKEPIVIDGDGGSIAILPSDEFKISYTLNYNHPLLNSQFLELSLNSGVFKKELASARTFCLEDEADQLQRQGIGCGADYSNTLVIGKTGVINNKLRYPDEFVRHKVLDLIGDLYLLGQPVKGHVVALRSGHALNLKLAQRINQQKQKYAVSSAKTTGLQIPEGGIQLDTDEIKKILPHRDPFLFVDRVIYLDKGRRAIGIKNLTMNDYFFKGHFPGRPVTPGVLILEAMAQVGGVMMLAAQENRGKFAFFMAVDNAKFRKTVLPGDELVLDVEAGKIKSKTGQVHGRAFVDGKLVSEADLMFALVD